MTCITVNVEIPSRLDRYLRRNYPELTQGIIEQLLRRGQIKLNGRKVHAGIRVVNGDKILIQERVSIKFNSSSSIEQSFSPAIKNLAGKLLQEYQLYSDDNLLAINKPHALATQGGSKIRLSIQDALCYLNTKGNDFKLVHRLDKDTSGLLLIAKNYLTAYKLTTAFSNKTIQKIYLAIVYGRPPQSSGEIQGMIAKNRTGVYEKVADDNNGKLAITKYKVLATDGKRSLIEFIPLTGRMHQLRFHALKLGCPIIGDKKYSTSITKHEPPMLLHARKIIIPSSLWGFDLTIEADLPEYFLTIMNSIN
ncbi:RluA family pseudouridine synthase [Candidatus Trichorickettsia mobilis]|uniref:Ribosomal large subunit pseudouridine synthase C n=1 Tax=Candidatus Trichorickettsia mobilis TaxID=1346319 RepID=A0ABZ0URC4_9RICK|nr:RluA family pseudouridine synthase [Candidatus Trichorickettsia mobilis]WPY00193.1 RluA family pseudouridine synthase [Candidatus Trichorickettsia mobilis]